MVMVTMNYTTSAASIIPDTPIVSIAGSTLSEITTTTTSTKITPTPVPTSNDANKSNSSSNIKEIADGYVETGISFGVSSNTAEVASPSLLKSSAILLKLMSDTNLPSSEADNNNLNEHNLNNSVITSTSFIKSTDPYIKHCPSNITENDLSNVNRTSERDSVALTDGSATIIENDSNDPNLLTLKPTIVLNSTSTINTKKSPSKEEKSLSGSWEECRLKDWDDNQLKELLEEAYHYKNPRDKENKSKAFLQLLEKAENEDASYPFGALMQRPLSNSITSSNYYSYHKLCAHHHTPYNSHNNSCKNNNCNNINNNPNNSNNNNNNSHHSSLHKTHKQGGSLQDLFNEAKLDCDHIFGSTNSSVVGGGNQRFRRQNHNSRQKKYSSSISSRQREGGSLPSNVNATRQLSSRTTTAAAASAIGSGGAHAVDVSSHIDKTDFDFLNELNVPVVKSTKKEQKRSAKINTIVVTSANIKNNNFNVTNNNNNNDEDKADGNQLLTALNQSVVQSASSQACIKSGDDKPFELCSMNSTITKINTVTTPNFSEAKTRDCIIEIGDPIMDVQQQQQILLTKRQDVMTQDVPPTTYYENLSNVGGEVPRDNFIKTKCNSFASTKYHCYVDESIKFTNLESVCGDSGNGTGNGNSNCSTINVRTARNKSQKKNAIDNDTVMSTVPTVIGTAAGTIKNVVGANTTKYLPLDDNYKSCISVLGSNVGDTASDMLCLKPKCFMACPKTLLPNIQSPVTSSPALTGITVQHQHQAQQQPSLDENGNALCEFYQSVANMSVGAAVHLGVPPPVTLVNVPTSATMTISAASHTASSSVSTPPSIVNTSNSSTSGGSGGSIGIGVSVGANGCAGTLLHVKSKGKKKSLQERNTKTVDVESVAGYRGNDPVEELVKYIESGEGGSSNVPSKGSEKKKDRRKDKEKHQKLKKSNSLEELRSGAKLDLQEIKRSAATTDTNTIIMRQKQSNKQNKQNSSSSADIHKSSDNNKNQNHNNGNNNCTQLSMAHVVPGGTYKNDQRSFGMAELKCLDHQRHQLQQHANGKDMEQKVTICIPTNTNSGAVNNAALTLLSTKDRQRPKSSVKQLDTKEKDRDNKEATKDKTKEYNEANVIINNHTVIQEQQQKQRHISTENNEKQPFNGKLDKFEMKLIDDKIDKRKKDVPSNAVTIVDILSMESVLPETAEFHVVTKRKKPKKQKLNSNVDETTVTLSRSQNFSVPKAVTVVTPNNSQGQNCGRYRHQSHEAQPSYQIAGTIQDYRHRTTTRSGGGEENDSNRKSKDTSRRKSISSMPSSEKSDISDEDSVHSLPIERTSNVVPMAKVNTTTGPIIIPFRTGSVKTASAAAPPYAVTATKVTQNKRNKPAKHSQQLNNVPSVPSGAVINVIKTTITAPLAPISYADIARNKDIKTNGTQIEIANNSVETIVQLNPIGLSSACGGGGNSNANTIVLDDESKVQFGAFNNINGKSHKIKKSLQKGVFAELRSNDNNNSIIQNNVLNSTSGAPPSISSAGDLQKQIQKVAVPLPELFVSTKVATAASSGNPLNEVCQNDKVNIDQTSAATVAIKSSNNNTKVHTTNVKVLQQQQSSQQQNMSVLHKAESIDHYDTSNQQQESMYYNNNCNVVATTFNHPGLITSNLTTPTYQVINLDQQYPTLEKTVKRHSNSGSISNSNNTAMSSEPTTLIFNSAKCVPTQNCMTTTITTHTSKQSINSTSTFTDTVIQANTIIATTSQSTHIENNEFNSAAASKTQPQKAITSVGSGVESNNGSNFQSNSNIKEIIVTTSSSLKNNNSGNTSNINNSIVTNSNKQSKERISSVDNSLILSTSSTSALSALLPNSTSVQLTSITSHGNNVIAPFLTSTPSYIMNHGSSHLVQPQAIAATTTQALTGLSPAQIPLLRRSKKERQQQQLVYHVLSSNNTKVMGQSNNNNNNDNNNNNRNCDISSNQQCSMNKLTKSQLKSSSILSANDCSSSSSSSNNNNNNNNKNNSDNNRGGNDEHQLFATRTTINSNVNRPPVIIMHDDGSRHISNEIIFGDFGEEVRELLFQDVKCTKEDFIMASTATTNCDNSATPVSYLQDEPIRLKSAEISSYTTEEHNLTQTSQNSSVITANRQNQYKYAHDVSEKMTMQIEKQQRYSSPTGGDSNVNYVLPSSANGDKNISSNIDLCMMEVSLPQQLETCNDIETAIIAAARAQQHYQEKEQQQMQYRNSKSPSNSSSFASSMAPSIAVTPTNNTVSHNYGNSHIYNTSNIQNNHTNSHYSQRRRSLSVHGKRSNNVCAYRQTQSQSQSIQQQQQQQQLLYPQLHELHNENFDGRSTSIVSITSTYSEGGDLQNNTNLHVKVHSPNRVCCILISQTNGPYKEVHFVQSPAPPLTYNQHRRHDQLVDFISSSWDDILNSNGTQMYTDNK